MKTIIPVIFVFLFCLQTFSQNNPDSAKAIAILKNRGEVVLKFPKRQDLPLNKLTLMVSISRVEKDSIMAYVNYKQFQKFLELHLPFRIVEKKSLESSLKFTGNIWSFNKYPTYTEYVSMMDSFSKAFPSLCKTINIGQTVKKRKLLFVRINSDTTKAKPSVMYSSTMHGDETGGYILMLHLTDYLLTNYKKDLLVTKLIDSLDIWINPLANPDGTYFDTTTVQNATRENANGADLNRNFPDPVEGIHPDGLSYQPETQAMMSLMAQHHFVLSANYHAGDEVVNYPWDSRPNSHQDSDWFKYISAEYADSTQKFGRSAYFTSVTPNGITDGYSWYAVYGGRQDYMTYFCQGREVTIELDVNYITPESNLINLWNYNYRSMLHYLEQALYGLHGFVFDAATLNPVKAKIELVGHDDDNSFEYSDPQNGSYFRPVYAGNYTLTISSDGYQSITMSNISIQNYQTKYYNFYLKASKIEILRKDINSQPEIFPNPCKNSFQIKGIEEFQRVSIKILSSTGEQVFSTFITNDHVINFGDLTTGIYFVQIRTQNGISIRKIEIIQ